MPFVLNQKITDSNYFDEIGRLYHVSLKTMKAAGIIKKSIIGEQFIYYQPKMLEKGGEYFGTGIIEKLEQDSMDSGMMWAHLGKYKKFYRAVPLHDAKGLFVETNSARQPMFVLSFREISKEIFERIIKAGQNNLAFATI